MQCAIAPERISAVIHEVDGSGVGGCEEEAVTAALHWNGNAPLAARQSLEADEIGRCQEVVRSIEAVMNGSVDALQTAANWRADGLKRTVNWQLRVATQAMRIKALGDESEDSLAMQAISSKLDLKQLSGICEDLLELKNALQRQLNPGDQLALEGLAVSWRDAALRNART